MQDLFVKDFRKVICIDRSAFTIGDFAGNAWVTRNPKEEDLKASLVLTFPKLDTIIMWGYIYGNIKCFLIFWYKVNWGTTINGPTYCTHIIHPYLFLFGQELSQHA